MQGKCLILVFFAVSIFLLSGCGGRMSEEPLPGGQIAQETFVHPNPEVLERRQREADQGKETLRVTSPEKVARLLEPELFQILPSDEVRLKELSQDKNMATVEVVRKGHVVAEVDLTRYRSEESGIWFVSKIRVFLPTP